MIGVPFGKYSQKSGGPARSPVRNRPPAGGGGWDTKSWAFDGIGDYVIADGVARATTNFDWQDDTHSVSVWFKTTNTAQQALWSFGHPSSSVKFWYLQTQGASGGDAARVKLIGKAASTSGLFGKNDATSSPHGATGEVWVQSDDTNGIDPSDGDWHNVIVTFTGQASTAQAVKMYIDGNYVAFSKSLGSDLTVDDFSIGVFRYDGGDEREQYFRGSIAQVSMWTSALSPSNATAVYALGNSMDTRLLTPAPIHLYRFGDGDSNGPSALDDYGSGSQDGTGEGSPTIVTDSPP